MVGSFSQHSKGRIEAETPLALAGGASQMSPVNYLLSKQIVYSETMSLSL